MIALTGGGTGGHLSIVNSLLQSASKQNLECIYIGSENGQDKKWFENQILFKAQYFLNSTGVVNQNKLGKIRALSHILKLAFECKKIFKNHKIKAVFSVGGYSAAPASFGAILANIPLFIHEQNSKKGSLNTLLKPFSKIFFSAFEENFCPYPVDEKFFQNARTRDKLETIIFLGGSQGANFINKLALELAPILHQNKIKIIHQCGKNDLEFCKKNYKNLDIEADVFDFSKNLESKMQKADLAVSRAGASTLFELCANELPSIFIPYPYATKNHQFFNAKFLEDKNLCKIFTEKDFNKALFLESIFKLDLKFISQNLKGQVSPNAADFMLKRLKEVVKL
ncbi:UDP-N-acetylglucosamine--N-acetylmuramyl-(pentapeptide) pyrophosphoryl-undecaprenol N-acetylglucosamine transferase [Campylobacter cuniculorum]|uniref:UDP-N-acetylglucosamine--N-acetylmuramyl-(pentapeptide) pyrophosphoryl-undecaprenol N-acetylglucosamine transferase n=3 Tax=Campylobacter cuniculorum TaxID=374106 RepID=A0A1W6BXJ7_9BACT|nr:N-acetylglucosaminyl transferase [Campylobacter cuniculorum DSM 23162 = LMG 24588]QOR04307.1 UDP-N-acetylglucosamine--N-acetylmuramyl-(pentapeptide) pyrophosphoryl-undecaprenol N-acetylglucosamine transferase [Campylobacter cuniculorum]